MVSAKNLFSCSSEGRKVILDGLMSKLTANLYFWMNCAFNCAQLYLLNLYFGFNVDGICKGYRREFLVARSCQSFQVWTVNSLLVVEVAVLFSRVAWATETKVSVKIVLLAGCVDNMSLPCVWQALIYLTLSVLDELKVLYKYDTGLTRDAEIKIKDYQDMKILLEGIMINHNTRKHLAWI